MPWVDATMGPQRFLLFTYEDSTGGPSGKGVVVAGPTATIEEARQAAEQPSATVRLTGVTTTPLPPEWVAYLRLPAKPTWMQFFEGASKPWRDDPLLAGKFHPEMPDDLEVTFILVAQKTLEKMWVRVNAAVPDIGYRGTLLNTSHVVPALAAGSVVDVRPSKSHPPALWVPEVAAANLAKWSTVCASCGFDLLFVPVSDLVKMQFPNIPPGAVMDRFTTRCLMCRETMNVANRGS